MERKQFFTARKLSRGKGGKRLLMNIRPSFLGEGTCQNH